MYNKVMYIKPVFVDNEIYHMYNRGVAKQNIFNDERDYDRFSKTISYFLESKPAQKLSNIDPDTLKLILNQPAKDPIVEILAYCLMPNHFHLLVKQLKVGGITNFTRRTFDSYTRYYNTRHDRVGTIYQGKVKGVHIDNDTQLLHVSRYIHLNPYVDKLVDNPTNYKWSSYQQYIRNYNNRACNTSFILSIMDKGQSYKDFVMDYAEYARDIAYIKKFTLDE